MCRVSEKDIQISGNPFVNYSHCSSFKWRLNLIQKTFICSKIIEYHVLSKCRNICESTFTYLHCEHTKTSIMTFSPKGSSKTAFTSWKRVKLYLNILLCGVFCYGWCCLCLWAICSFMSEDEGHMLIKDIRILWTERNVSVYFLDTWRRMLPSSSKIVIHDWIMEIF